MPDPTDPRAVADDPSGIVQQMPDGGDDTLAEIVKRLRSQDPIPSRNEVADAIVKAEADLRAEVERQAYDRGWRAAIEALADAEKKQVAAGLTGRDYYGRRLEAKLLSRTIRTLSPETDGGQDG